MLLQTTVILDKTFQSKKGDYSAWKRGGALHMMNVNYRSSAIVLDERTTEDVGGRPYSNDDGKICAGDRAPGASGLIDFGGKEITLFDVFKPVMHTVLIFGKVSESPVSTENYPKGTIQVITILPKGPLPPQTSDVVVVDREGHAYTAYAVEEGRETVVVIRPDGVIGAIIFNIEGLEKYFKKIFQA